MPDSPTYCPQTLPPAPDLKGSLPGSTQHSPARQHCPGNYQPSTWLTKHTKEGSITSTRISISTGSYSVTNWSHCQGNSSAGLGECRRSAGRQGGALYMLFYQNSWPCQPPCPGALPTHTCSFSSQWLHWSPQGTFKKISVDSMPEAEMTKLHPEVQLTSTQLLHSASRC